MSWSRAYASAVLDPFAEQLVDLGGVGAGMRVVDVLAGAGRLTRLLARRVGAGGRVIAVEQGHAAAEDLREELGAARVDAAVTDADAAALPFPDGNFDVAVSLLGITAARGGTRALGEVARVARRVAVLVPQRSVLEDALLAALTAAGAAPPVELLAALQPLTPPPGWNTLVVGDVARFDSIALLWQALIEHHLVSVEAERAAGGRRLLGEMLARHAGPDGTLRVPVQACLLSAGG